MKTCLTPSVVLVLAVFWALADAFSFSRRRPPPPVVKPPSPASVLKKQLVEAIGLVDVARRHPTIRRAFNEYSQKFRQLSNALLYLKLYDRLPVLGRNYEEVFRFHALLVAEPYRNVQLYDDIRDGLEDLINFLDAQVGVAEREARLSYTKGVPDDCAFLENDPKLRSKMRKCRRFIKSTKILTEIGCLRQTRTLNCQLPPHRDRWFVNNGDYQKPKDLMIKMETCLKNFENATSLRDMGDKFEEKLYKLYIVAQRLAALNEFLYLKLRPKEEVVKAEKEEFLKDTKARVGENTRRVKRLTLAILQYGRQLGKFRPWEKIMRVWPGGKVVDEQGDDNDGLMYSDDEGALSSTDEEGNMPPGQSEHHDAALMEKDHLLVASDKASGHPAGENEDEYEEDEDEVEDEVEEYEYEEDDEYEDEGEDEGEDEEEEEEDDDYEDGEEGEEGGEDEEATNSEDEEDETEINSDEDNASGVEGSDSSAADFSEEVPKEVIFYDFSDSDDLIPDLIPDQIPNQSDAKANNNRSSEESTPPSSSSAVPPQ